MTVTKEVQFEKPEIMEAMKKTLHDMALKEIGVPKDDEEFSYDFTLYSSYATVKIVKKEEPKNAADDEDLNPKPKGEK